MAGQMLRAIDRRLAAGGVGAPAGLLLPPGGMPPPLRAMTVRRVAGAGRSLHAWEQLRLPRAARGGLLLNLSGSAPALAAPQVCFVHDAAVFDHPEAYTAAFRQWYRFLFRRLSRTARLLFTVSAFSRARLAVALGVPQDRILVVPNGADHLADVVADTSVLATHGLADHPFLLAVGSANPTKNLATLLDAWRVLNRGDTARLVLVGGNNARVFADHRHVEVPGLVRLGHVGDAALKALYGRAVGLVFPSIYEGFGMPPLEAMACGCPVAASTAASLPEVCGGAALEFDPHSVSAIAAAMRALLDDAALRERLRVLGLRRAAGYRWDDAAALLLGHLETVR